MKIVIITPYFYPKIGGVEQYVYQIGKGLRETFKHDVVVVTTNDQNNSYLEETISGMKTYRLSKWISISNTPINLLWLIQIRKIIKSEQPDLIMAHTPVVFMADLIPLVKGKTPLITTIHSGSMLKESGILNTIIKFYEKYVLPKLFASSTQIICISPTTTSCISPRFRSKLAHIPPGIDTKIFHPTKTSRTNDLLYVGRIESNSSWKGIKYLLDAVAILNSKLPDLKLRLIGSGNQVSFFQHYCHQLGITDQVTFAGSKFGPDLAKEYQSSKILILPSISEAESFGMVLIEAMACQTPVIGSRVGGIPSLISDGENGLLFPPKNSQALAETIYKLINSPELALSLANQAYAEVISNYAWEQQIAKTQHIIEKVIN